MGHLAVNNFFVSEFSLLVNRCSSVNVPRNRKYIIFQECVLEKLASINSTLKEEVEILKDRQDKTELKLQEVMCKSK